ncbi:serine/threonine-protein kinase [Gilvimarinus polysaccharolyticus]|uniref:serine/threonine-protein kinase n=1 Tax=Gilvimarinus polysaccharolyticus TaxID=863921 RepID=UPI00067311FA|nr:serine/threonine-protein kinase [Gilvimarinus polysaccharolyticus]
MEIPGYKIIDTLGEGGMATVYLAIQQSFEREVAIKVMSPQLSKDPSFGERFLREARIVSRLVHPNIVTVYDVGVYQDKHYLSMEYVPGEDLKQRRGGLSLAQMLTLIKDVARALDYAGSKGYIHRDVKPDNIMLHAEDDRAVLMDFGIARATDISSGMTQTGTTMGTPHYMSPEQAKGAAVDPRSDIYSLGVVLFQLLAGRVPFDADSAVAVGIMHVSESVPVLPEYLALFQPIIDKVLAKKPAERYQTGRELVDDLDALPREALAAAQEQMLKVPLIDPVSETESTPIANAQVTATSDIDLHETAGVSGFHISGADSIGDFNHTVATPTLTEPASRAGKWSMGVLLLLLLGAAGWYFGLVPRELPLLANDTQLDAAPNTPTAVQLNPPVKEQPVPASSQSSSVQSAGVLSEPAALEATVLSLDAASAAGDVLDDPELSAAAPSPLLQTVQQQRAQLELDPEQGVLLAQSYEQLRNSEVVAEQQAGEVGIAELTQWFDVRITEALAARDTAKAGELAAIIKQAVPDAERDAGYQAALKSLRADEWLAAKLADAESYLEQDALSSPSGANAVDSYREVLKTYPDNAAAQAGLQAVVSRYTALAQAAEAADTFERAITLVDRGLQINPSDAALTELRERLVNLNSQIEPLMARVGEQLASGALIAPKTDNAFVSLRSVLAIRPNYEPALQALDEIEQTLIRRIDAMIAAKSLEEASLQLASARDRFPQSQALLTRRLQIEQLNEASLPLISKLSVSAQPIDAVSAARDVVLVADRIIYLGFEYSQFKSETSVVQASLFDGSRSLKIAQVPVIVSGASGVKFFRIERPVAGFGEGGYHVDLMLGEQRLATVVFQVVK